MATETDEIVCTIVIALTELNATVAATLTALGKHVMGQSAEARTAFQKAAEMQDKAGESMQTLINIAGRLVDQGGNN